MNICVHFRLTAALTNFIRELIPNGKNFVECDNDLNSYEVSSHTRIFIGVYIHMYSVVMHM
jgi:hypothetical protein